ncbi:hypothetical protein E2C01_027269 [Portunus trituberculatus]|uniref:Uncharacterized protein n=1 Tax=Portunus trituberculatus TaxID=210409 RepID=A0A5B7EHR5_PORTR|nr:hypothetical protein [Portunus trituberculatus]
MRHTLRGVELVLEQTRTLCLDDRDREEVVDVDKVDKVDEVDEWPVDGVLGTGNRSHSLSRREATVSILSVIVATVDMTACRDSTRVASLVAVAV